MAVYGRQRPAQTLVRTAVSARSMVRMGSPVRFRRGARPKTAGQARSCTQPVAYRELRTAICQRIASPICTLCVGARRLPMPLRGDHRQPAPRVTPEAVEHPVLLPGRPAGRRRRRPGQGRAVGVRSVVITSDSASSPASTRSAAASKQAAEVAQAWDSIARRRGERRCRRPGWSHRRRSRLRHGPAEHDPGGLGYGQPAVSRRAGGDLHGQIDAGAPPAGPASGRTATTSRNEPGCRHHGRPWVRSRSGSTNRQSDSTMRPASSSTKFRTPTAVLVGDMRVAPAVGRGRDGSAACYLLAPSLTWSPVCPPAASWAACPAATRSGIIGPSPEGSMIPASSQV